MHNGDRAAEVATLFAAGHGRRLAESYPYVEAEVVWAAREEYAQTVIDVLARRTRLAFLDRASAEHAVERVARLLATELSWDEERLRREIETARHLGK